MNAVQDEPQEPQTSETTRPPPPPFEAPHMNGAVHHDGDPPKRKHAPWEFLILALVRPDHLHRDHRSAGRSSGSHSPEKLDAGSAAAVSAACNTAAGEAESTTRPRPHPRRRHRARRRVCAPRTWCCATMVDRDRRGAGRRNRRPRRACGVGLNDWTRMIDARDVYASSLEALAPIRRTRTPRCGSSIRPVARSRRSRPTWTTTYGRALRCSNACFTAALQLEVVEGPRVYVKVTIMTGTTGRKGRARSPAPAAAWAAPRPSCSRARARASW